MINEGLEYTEIIMKVPGLRHFFTACGILTLFCFRVNHPFGYRIVGAFQTAAQKGLQTVSSFCLGWQPFTALGVIAP